MKSQSWRYCYTLVVDRGGARALLVVVGRLEGEEVESEHET